MTDKRREVEEIRQELAKTDLELLALLERRAKLAKRTGSLRAELNLPAAPFGHAELDALVRRGGPDTPPEALRDIFQKIFAVCLSLEQPLVIAFSGHAGGFSHAAARSRFGVAANYLPLHSAEDAVGEVTRQRANYAVVPFETRADGLLQSTIAAITESDAKLVGAFEFGVNLQIASMSATLADVQRVFATSRDRSVCQTFFGGEFAHVEVVEVPTPFAACSAAATDGHAAALVHEDVIADFPLQILKRNVRDGGDERMRYAVVGTRPSSRTGADFTGIVVAVSDTPGALHEVLQKFADRGVNLTNIQSRPTPSQPWQYLFFIEVEGHATDRPVVGALEELRKLTKFLKVLGSYQLG